MLKIVVALLIVTLPKYRLVAGLETPISDPAVTAFFLLLKLKQIYQFFLRKSRTEVNKSIFFFISKIATTFYFDFLLVVRSAQSVKYFYFAPAMLVVVAGQVTDVVAQVVDTIFLSLCLFFR